MLNSNKMADKAMGYFPFAAKSQSKSKMQKICWPKRKKYKTRGTKNCILIMFNWHSSIWAEGKRQETHTEKYTESENVCARIVIFTLNAVPFLFRLSPSPFCVSLSFSQVGRTCCCSSFRIQGAQSVLCVPVPDFNKHTPTHSLTHTHPHTHTHLHLSKVFAFNCMLFVYCFCIAFTTLTLTLTLKHTHAHAHYIDVCHYLTYVCVCVCAVVVVVLFLPLFAAN